MTANTDTEHYYAQGRGIALLWLGVLAGPIAWALQLQVNYSLMPWICGGGSMLVVHVVTVAALLLAAIGAFAAWRSWQHAGRGWPSGAGDVIERTRFMAVWGMVFSTLFFVLIVMQAIPSFILPPCAY